MNTQTHRIRSALLRSLCWSLLLSVTALLASVWHDQWTQARLRLTANTALSSLPSPPITVFVAASPRATLPLPNSDHVESSLGRQPEFATSSLSQVPLHAAATSEPGDASFPEFGRARHPVARVPHWGTMTSSREWDRPYAAMRPEDFIPVPPYDPSALTVPMEELLRNRDANAEAITAKLYYSTRHFGAYDLDAGEWTGPHPGIDLKLPIGTPVGAVAGGRVRWIRRTSVLGLHIIIEHRRGSEAFYSVYGHLSSSMITEGDDVAPGAIVGFVGMTGSTTAPHLHLQIDRGELSESNHVPYAPDVLPLPVEAEARTVHPILFQGY